jgi:hypothetical protein
MIRHLVLALAMLTACGTTGSSAAIPLPDQVDILYIGDSMGMCGAGIGPLFGDAEPTCEQSFMVLWAQRMEREFGVSATVSSWAVGEPAAAANHLANTEQVRNAAGEAEVLFLSTYGTLHSECVGVQPEDLDAFADEARAEVDDLFAEVASIVDVDRVMVRSVGTPWLATMAYDDAGAFIPGSETCIVTLGNVIADLGAEHGIVVVDMLDAFNGEPPFADMTHLLRDDRHLNAEGALFAAQVLHDRGYAPFTTAG